VGGAALSAPAAAAPSPAPAATAAPSPAPAPAASPSPAARLKTVRLRPPGVDTPTSGATPATPAPRPPLATIQSVSATLAKELRAERSVAQSFKEQARKDFTSLEVS
jgi:hypothetical protein